MAKPLLEVKDLHTFFKTVDGTVKAVNGVSFEVEEGRVLGIVGESGSGKTVTALSIMQLVPHPGKVIQGSVLFAGQELVGLGEKAMRGLRGRELSMVFQNAAEALNPVIPVGDQITEVVHQHMKTSFREARALAASLLTQMGIPDAKALLESYPYQISGGMAQRVMLAMGIALKPRLLIADEPTSNLDVTVQAEILHRLEQQRKENNASVLLITHDLGVIAQMAQEVVIMYGGRVMERADTRGLYARPRHPYTAALLKAIPRVDSAGSRLQAIKGSLPKMIDPPDQCPYLERCTRAINSCRTGSMPKLAVAEPGHMVACYNPIPKPT
ncbi:MAG: ABC transporter ATP-binding protein [SAR202 cluster bacterium]|nr:ABC transporter ATP-binding protein [SAR202 cluster bacterium]